MTSTPQARHKAHPAAYLSSVERPREKRPITMIYADIHQDAPDTWVAEIINPEPLRHVVVARPAPTEEAAEAEANRVLELIA